MSSNSRRIWNDDYVPKKEKGMRIIFIIIKQQELPKVQCD